jgi:hypothetical protein
MRLGFVGIAAAVAVLLLAPNAVGAGNVGHYLPRAGDRFQYTETITVTNGQGNYSGYSEDSNYTGSISVTEVATNGTDNASYEASGTYENSQGQHSPWSESGTFTFSALNFSYVRGTDNQTGYVHPSVWFFMNASLPRGGSFELLNTPMTVVSTDVPFAMASSPTGYVAAIFAEGNGSYQRDDAYGNFLATYNWKAYFDPGTGYNLGYVYTETDSNSAGDGFTYTDTLTDSATTFSLTPVAGPPAASSSSSGSTTSWLIVGIVLAVVLIVVVLVIILARRRRRPSALPRHPSTPAPGTMPSYAPPPPINLIPRDQPPVQQVVIRETVKVPCRYCGTLIDSTATNCPNCGAPRT